MSRAGLSADRWDVIVVGGGAAGLLCAGFAAKRGRKVLIVEKGGRTARKILITGKGRCNVTNDCDPDTFIKMVRGNGRFLYSAINAFSTSDTMAFFEGLGIPLKTERGRRVFPCSDRAGDIASALERFAEQSGARIRLNSPCSGLILREQGVEGVILEDGGRLSAPSVVVATGGMSYPATGSDGGGYRLARQAGHIIVEPRPSLVPVVTQEDCRPMMGLSLKNVTLKAWDKKKGKPVFSDMGEMLFTHFGVSGPLVLSASGHMEPARLKDFALSVNLKPALSPQQLDKRILRDFEENANRDYINSLSALLPRKIIPEVVARSGIPPGCKVHQVTREQRQALAGVIQDFILSPKAFRPIEEAIVTAGGVKVSEVDPRTMGSKRAAGLFFAGEILDVDAYTGGYNLQAAFSTAYLAAQAV